MNTPDILIIGGGVIGASVAYHLAQRGCTDVLVVDAGAGPGAGSTARATGGFRTQFGSAVNVRLSLDSLDKLRRFEAETGVDPGYRPVGYLFIARDEAGLQTLREAQAVQRENSLKESMLVTPDDVVRINPAVHYDCAGGCYCPIDGYIRPLALLQGYTEAARRAGVRFEYGRRVTRLRVERGRMVSAELTGGTVAPGAVVNAAGAWAAAVAALAGLDLPVRPLRRQVAVTRPTNVLPDDMPMTVFTEDGFHVRTRDGRAVLLWPDAPATADPFDTSVEPTWLRQVELRAAERLPSLRDVGIDVAQCTAGLYEMSPDSHALLGAMPEVDNIHAAGGSSGHGVMHAPALGEIAAGVLIDGWSGWPDAHALRATRFAEDDPIPGAALL